MSRRRPLGCRDAFCAEVAQYLGHAAMTGNPERRTRDTGLNIYAHLAAAGHASPKDFIVQSDVAGPGALQFRDIRLPRARLSTRRSLRQPMLRVQAFGIEDGLAPSAR